MEKRTIVTEFGEVVFETVDIAKTAPTKCATDGKNCVFMGVLSYQDKLYAGVHIHNDNEFHICFLDRLDLVRSYESDGKDQALYFQGPFMKLLEAITGSIQEYLRWIDNEANAQALDRARGFADISPLDQVNQILKQ